jgi:ATP-dependent exoDNAse (exonuclease V) beta subunit
VIDQPIDATVRQQALDVRRSFAVSAPAGSGKTGLLTQRVLNLLAHADQPENILAMTFTRKAADEMHHRIISALQMASNDQLQASNPHQQLTFDLARAVLNRDKERQWQLLTAPHRLRVQTIDGFCQYLVDQLPIHSGVHDALSTTEYPEHLYQHCVCEFFTLLNHCQHQSNMAVLLAHVDNNLFKLEHLLTSLLRKRNQWLSVLFKSTQTDAANQVLQDSLRRNIEDGLSLCEQAMAGYLSELLPLLQYKAEQERNEAIANFIETFTDHSPSLEQRLRLWKTIADTVLTKGTNPDSCNLRKTVDARSGFPSSKDKDSREYNNRQAMLALLTEFSKEEYLLPYLRDIKALPPLDSDIQQAVIHSLTQLLPLLVAQFRITCREQGECDFDEIALAAVGAFGEDQEPTDLALRLDYQIKHILVDEFQDTSLLQLNLLEKLTAGWQRGDDRTLFVVGDAMQSCYGFRDAKVSLFLRVRQQGIGTVSLTPLDLQVNFRSDAVIVNWVNQVFSQVLPSQDNLRRGAVRYRHAQASASTGGQASVATLAFAEDIEQVNAIVSLVRKHWQQSETDTIAILARNRSHLPQLLAAFREADIAWEAQDVDALRSQMTIVDLLSLTKAVSDVSDRISWLAILRAPWCGLDMQDLYQLAHNGENIWQQIVNVDTLRLSTEGLAIVSRLKNIIVKAFANSHRKPFRQWLEGIWLVLGGPANIANPGEANSAEHFFDLVEQHCGAWGIENWDRFEQSLDRLYATSPHTSRLKVMTLHKSKGLEFDVVILPHLEKTSRSDNKDLLLWEDTVDELGHINFLLSASAEHGNSNPLYDYLWREQNIARDLESARLLYVACTRAIKHLYLCACTPVDEKGLRKQPPAKSLLAKLWPVLADDFSPVELTNKNSPEFTNSQESKILNRILRLSHDRKAVNFPVDPTLAAYRRPAFFHQEELPTSDSLLNRYQRYCGTVIHRALEIACLQGWRQYDPTAQQMFWAIQLRQLGVPENELGAYLDIVQSALELTLSDPQGQWLLDNNHQDSVCEWSISGLEAGPLRTMPRDWIIDRSFVDRGVRWVIDYKSSVPEPGQALQDFLTQEANHYFLQLQAYQRAVVALDTSALDSQYPVHIALYFPRLAQFYPLQDLKLQ